MWKSTQNWSFPCFLSLLILWEFRTMCSGHTSPPISNSSQIPPALAIQLYVLFLKTEMDQFVLPRCTWVCDWSVAKVPGLPSYKTLTLPPTAANKCCQPLSWEESFVPASLPCKGVVCPGCAQSIGFHWSVTPKVTHSWHWDFCSSVVSNRGLVASL